MVIMPTNKARQSFRGSRGCILYTLNFTASWLFLSALGSPMPGGCGAVGHITRSDALTMADSKRVRISKREGALVRKSGVQSLSLSSVVSAVPSSIPYRTSHHHGVLMVGVSTVGCDSWLTLEFTIRAHNVMFIRMSSSKAPHTRHTPAALSCFPLYCCRLQVTLAQQ